MSGIMRNQKAVEASGKMECSTAFFCHRSDLNFHPFPLPKPDSRKDKTRNLVA